MRMIASGLICLLVITTEVDQPSIQGTWSVVEYDQNGKRPPGDIVSRMKVVIKPDRITIEPKVVAQYKSIFKNGQKDVEVGFSAVADQAETAMYKLNAEKGWIELVWQGTRGETHTSKGLYLIEEDHLKICFPLADKKRPKKMPEQPKVGLVRLVLKRVEK